MTYAACPAELPGFVCGHADVITYLAPAFALAVLLRILTNIHAIFFLLTLVGTACHELCHYLVGGLTGAQPASFSLIPQRNGNAWTLGSVTFTNIRWWNAAPAALAPFLILAIPILFAAWRVKDGWGFAQFDMIDLTASLLLAPLFLSFWPSRVDWMIALRSWPYLALLYGWYAWQSGSTPE